MMNLTTMFEDGKRRMAHKDFDAAPSNVLNFIRANIKKLHRSNVARSYAHARQTA